MAMTLQQILTTIDQLPLEQQEQIQQHIEANKLHQQQSPPPKRIAGLGRGKVWMSEDFTHELPDEFWLGEEAQNLRM